MENSSFSAAAASGHPAAALVAFSQANEALRLSARPFPPQVPIYANYHLRPGVPPHDRVSQRKLRHAMLGPGSRPRSDAPDAPRIPGKWAVGRRLC